MSTERISLEELALAFDRHGSDLERWPPADAQRARAVLDESAAAQRLLAEARALDVLLEGDVVPIGVGRRVRARVLDSIDSSDPSTRFFAWLSRGPFLWRPAVLALIPLLIGIGAGVGASGRSDAELVSEIHALAFDSAEGDRDAE